MSSTAALAANWVGLRHTPRNRRRVAIVLANYPNRDGRIGNGVGYDTPASTINILRALQTAGYRVESVPASGNALIEALRAGSTNAAAHRRQQLSLSATIKSILRDLPAKIQADVTERWGPAQNDPVFQNGILAIWPFASFGNVAVAIQPGSRL